MWNTELISSITVGTAITVPIVIAVVQAIKMLDFVNEKYAPFIAILVGIAIAFLTAIEPRNWTANIMAGILFGLSASGLYSGVSATAHAIKAEKREKLYKKNKL